MKYRVVVKATYEEVFEVDAPDEKAAEEISIHAECMSSENVWNETMSIEPPMRENGSD